MVNHNFLIKQQKVKACSA